MFKQEFSDGREGMKRKPRILLAKVGLDGHDRGIMMEVIYTGLHQTPEQVAQVALQEYVDVVGISSLADAHGTLAPRVVQEIGKRGLDIPVLLGGFIQPEDIPVLEGKGVRKVFGINTRLDAVVKYIQDLIKQKGDTQ
jgi:methylmalonyl-CoA mutase cobalamin-binding domain/chain